MTEQILLETDDALVRILTLHPGEFGDWHHHSNMGEQVVCLSGQIHVQLTAPDELRVLQPSELASIPAGRTHRVQNPLAGPSSFVLVQGPGQYDFVVDESAPATSPK